MKIPIWAIPILQIVLLLSITENAISKVSKTPVLLSTIQLSGQYRYILQEIVNEFNEIHSDIELSYRVDLNDDFHEKREACLAEENCPVDIYLGFAGYSFEQNAQKGKIESISDLWQQEGFDLDFPHIKNSVSIEGKQYGLPISYYPWGFFYNKQVFESLDIRPPKTWQAFLEVCDTIKAANITPILIGTKTPFPAASWFSYINLRLHGLSFHKELTAGNIPYTNPRIEKTFKLWKGLIDKGYFNDNANQLTYIDVLPYLYRKKGAMYLMGNIVISQIPESLKSNIGYFPFPKIAPKIPQYEEAPLDILFIPKQSKHKAAAKVVLAFLSNPGVLDRYNNAAGYLSPNIKSKLNDDPFIRKTAQHLESSAGFSYFFNRNNPPEIGRPGTKLLGRFISSPDIKSTIREFEQLRGKLRIEK